MDFNKLTIKCGEAVAGAQELARRAGNPELTRDHLTIALLEQELPRTLPSAPVRARARSARGRGAPAGAAVRVRLERPAAGVGRAQPRARRRFDEAQQLDDEFVSVEHLVLALELVPRDGCSARSRRCAAASA